MDIIWPLLGRLCWPTWTLIGFLPNLGTVRLLLHIVQAFVDEVVDIGLMTVADKIRNGPDKLSELKKVTRT